MKVTVTTQKLSELVLSCHSNFSILENVVLIEMFLKG